ncbi:lipid A export ATP-binding/permease protein MsbA [Striga asiatica]|uniref:Lipid A export ATP-binding/permease protein MsbA n=1 Tax=Striga asiatica TaxID=4170 RepID=A0A5A7RJV1_STRAF|nr:lipid A export ATP-binding/permease protein MsbA [Striga asiatica]
MIITKPIKERRRRTNRIGKMLHTHEFNHRVFKLVVHLSLPYYDPNISPEEASRLDWDLSTSCLAASSNMSIITTKSKPNVETPLLISRRNSGFLTPVCVGTGRDPTCLW